MKHNQGGVKISLVVVSVILLGVSAWFNQAHAQSSTLHNPPSPSEELTVVT